MHVEGNANYFFVCIFVISPDDDGKKKIRQTTTYYCRSVERYERMIQSRKILFDVLQQPLFDVKI